MGRWWEELFPEEERTVYHGTHGGRRQRWGRRPALLVIDVTRAFCGEEGESLAESAARWPTSCGPAAWEAMPHIRRLLDGARRQRVPVVYTTAQPGADRLYGGTVKGEGEAMGSPMAWPGAQDIPDAIRPADGE